MTKVKILCDCGTKFAFEADESMTLADGAVACPNCGADGSPAANAQLLAARTGEEAAPATPRPSNAIRLTVDKPAVKPSGETNEEPEASESTPRRTRVPYEQARKPTRSEKQIRRNREAAQRRRPFLAVAIVLALALGVFWGWYSFVGSKPKVVMNAEYNRVERPLVPRLLANHEMLLIRNREVSLLSAPGGEVLWQKSLGNTTNFDDSLPNYAEVDPRVDRPTPAVRVTSNSFWIVWPDQILNIDRVAGAPLLDTELQDDPQILIGERLLLLETSPAGTNKIQFDVYPLSGGDKQLLQVPRPDSAPRPAIVPDGDSVVTVQTRLLESHIVTNNLSTGPKVMTAAGVERSVDNNFDKVLENTHTAGQSLSAATTLVNELNRRDEAQEPDETYEDRSRYEVELRRVQGGSSNWKGEIIGMPHYFPLPTVDVIAGEMQFKVIDKIGHLKWESPLSYPLSPEAVESSEFYRPVFLHPETSAAHDDQNGLRYRFPFVERADRLYAYDAGVLAAFDLASGEVQWRVTSVGIRKIIFDRDGFLYACTTQDGPQVLKKLNAARRDPPVHEIIKIDPRSGSVLWHAPYLGTDLFVSGKFIYSKWVGENVLDKAAALAAVTEAVPSCAITRIAPDSGEVMWRREYKGDPDTINIRENWLMIQFPRRIEVMKFFSL